MKEANIGILCVDDHAFLIDGLRARVAMEPDMEVVGQLASAEGLAEAVAQLEPRVVLVDIEMPGSDAFGALDDVRRRGLPARPIILSAYVRDHYVDLACEAGVWGYMLKSEPTNAIIEGIRAVARGETAFCDAVLSRCTIVASDGSDPPRAASHSRLSLLSAREQEVLRMIARGMSRGSIAESLCRSPMTVDNHRKSIMKKLGARDRAELVRYAIAEKLVEV